MPNIVVAEKTDKKNAMAQLEAIGRISAEKMILANDLTDAEIDEVSGLLRPWAAGEDVEAGVLRVYKKKLYECTQKHIANKNQKPSGQSEFWKIKSGYKKEK